MNILLAWELGGNWGHVARDLPVLRQLQAEGHHVIYAVREQHLATVQSMAIGIHCVAAPSGAKPHGMPRNLAGYAAILFADGFADATILDQRLTGWMRLFAEHATDVVVSDYAPGALLATRMSAIPSVALGSGFEIPPDGGLLPSFLGSAAQDEAARRFSEGLVLFNVNRVLHRLGASALERLAQVFQGERCVFTTFAELDHWGARPDATYVGHVQDLPGSVTAIWKTTNKPRVLVYLREVAPIIDEVLQALDAIGAQVIAVLPDMDRPIRHVDAHLQVFRQPVRINDLMGTTDLVIASGAGTITTALLAGVPVLTLPINVEQRILARRVEEMGAGISGSAGTVATLTDAIHRLLNANSFQVAAQMFATKYAGFNMASAVRTVIDEIHHASSSHS